MHTMASRDVKRYARDGTRKHFAAQVRNAALVRTLVRTSGPASSAQIAPHNRVMILALLTFISVGVLVLVVRSLLPAYVREKGKNLATKEDIAEITQQIEAVKTQHALVIETSNATHQLRPAAIDERLLAHQKAFKL